ncbi:MAG: YHS domain-containing protein [Kiritimatiellia bacterium]
MRKTGWIATAASMLLAAGGVVSALASDETPVPVPATTNVVKRQTICPVMGGEVNKNLYVDYEGKRIYVCCKGCIETVRKDPAKYVRELEAAGVTITKTQIACPVLGGKIDNKVYADYKGERVYFCCPGCIQKFQNDPEKYLKILEAEGIAPEPAATTDQKDTH